MKEVLEAIAFRDGKTEKLDLGGKTVVVVDASRSMMGSTERAMHPFLTALSVLSTIDSLKGEDVIFVGGKWVKTSIGTPAIIPMNHTDMWRGLVKAVKTGADNIVIISDGYENAVKGMFEHTYNYFKESGYKFNLIHFNPVFSAESKSGTARQLAKDIKPLPLTDYKFIETELIFNRMIENREMVKKILVNKYQKLLGGGGKDA